jgi:hypothetical protein
MQKDEALRSQLDVSVTYNGLVVAQPKPDSKLDTDIPEMTNKPDVRQERNSKFNQAEKKTFPANKILRFAE